MWLSITILAAVVGFGLGILVGAWAVVGYLGERGETGAAYRK